MLRKPPPFLAILNKVYGRSMDAVFLSDPALRSRVHKNCQDLLIGQDSHSVGAPQKFAVSIPSFLRAVLLVIGLAAKKEVLRVYASRLVACVAYFKLRMKRSPEVLVVKPAGHALPCPPRSHSVARRVHCTLPYPASLLVDFIAGKWVNALFSHSKSVTSIRVTLQGVR
jgi:hypothetical protein